LKEKNEKFQDNIDFLKKNGILLTEEQSNILEEIDQKYK